MRFEPSNLESLSEKHTSCINLDGDCGDRTSGSVYAFASKMNSEAFSEGPATSNRPLTGRGGNERLPHNSKAAKAWAALTEAIAKRARLWKRRLGVSHYQKRLTRIFAAVIAIVLLKVLLLDSKVEIRICQSPISVFHWGFQDSKIFKLTKRVVAAIYSSGRD